jgi:photosynthetic reaction center M subunit
VGPVYLGWLGIASLLCGFIAIEIIGLNMWASVNWDPIQFVRQLPWLALEPPPPAYGLSLPPLNEGGWWLLAGFFLTASILLWWTRVYTRARALGMGHPRRLGLRGGDLALPRARLLPPDPDGLLGRGGALRHLPHLDWTNAFSIRYGNLFYNPFHCLSIVFLYGSHPALRHARRHRSRHQPLRGRPRDRADRRPRNAFERGMLFWR